MTIVVGEKKKMQWSLERAHGHLRCATHWSERLRRNEGEGKITARLIEDGNLAVPVTPPTGLPLDTHGGCLSQIQWYIKPFHNANLKKISEWVFGLNKTPHH